MKNYWIYILASGRNGTLYVGITNDLLGRVYERKEKLVDDLRTSIILLYFLR